jgi:hypothetical protein
MTIGSISRADYVGNGTLDEYQFGYKIFNKEHLRVVVRNTADADSVDTELVLDTDFEVSDASVNNPDGGTITLLDANQAWLNVSNFLATGWSLAIIREVPLEQATDIKNQGAFYPKIHEDAFDYSMMALLQQQANLDRVFRLPDSLDPDDYDLLWPSNMIDNPGSMFIVNAAGTGLELGPNASDINAAQANATAAAASAAAALASQSAAAASATAAATSATNAAASAAAAAASAGITLSDTAFAATWNGVTTVAPSKNAVYDAFILHMARWRSILSVAGTHTAAQVAGTYSIPYGGNAIVANGVGSLYPIGLVAINSTEFAAMLGLAAKFRVRIAINCNDVAATGNFTWGLYPVTRPATSGGVGVNIFTLGTVVAGSTTAISGIAADYANEISSSDITLPANGIYCLGLVTTATIPASCHLHMAAWLDVKYA